MSWNIPAAAIKAVPPLSFAATLSGCPRQINSIFATSACSEICRFPYQRLRHTGTSSFTAFGFAPSSNARSQLRHVFHCCQYQSKPSSPPHSDRFQQCVGNFAEQMPMPSKPSAESVPAYPSSAASKRLIRYPRRDQRRIKRIATKFSWPCIALSATAGRNHQKPSNLRPKEWIRICHNDFPIAICNKTAYFYNPKTRM